MSDSNECLFCKIVRGEIPAKTIATTEHSVAFADVNPKAPTHVLVIPKRHVEHLGEFARTGRADEVHDLLRLVASIGADASKTGYRAVTNEGPDAGQSVFHLHFHVLAGRELGWPPG